ncbi:MAG: exosome complex protein Rrp42 [Candidatus Thermoplasmatota archaeon]|nr:exosome complex protein Rrp42 [Candidatus Thermoplasmatota archaeon]
MKDVVSELLRDHIYKMAASGKRVDGRAPEEYREIKVRKGYAGNAEGSARVNLGETEVLVGVKMILGEPYPDRPKEGSIVTTMELIPMASPTFEAGPPREKAIELARVVDRGIRESKAIDLGKLCIIEGEKVWIVFIDVHVLDYGGNLFDASSFGALAALTNAVVPASKINGEDYPLEVEHHPISITATKIKDVIVFDASLDEDRVADARFTIATDENGHIRAMQKGLKGSFTLDEIDYVVKTAKKLADEIRPKVVG